MPTYIADGYTRPGYVVAPRVAEDVEPLFEPFEFDFRVGTRLEVIRHDAEIDKLAKKGDDPENAVKLEMVACKFVADHLQSWDLRDHNGNDVAISVDSVSRLQPYLFQRIYRIIRNTEVSDSKPCSTEAPLSDTDLQKN